MGLLNRFKLLEKEKVQIEKVDLGNNEVVYVKQMTGRERENFEKSLFVIKRKADGTPDGIEQKMEDFRAKLVVCTVCDEKGVLLLQPGDYAVLSENMSAVRLDKIATAAQILNKVTPEQKEDLSKNLNPAQDDNFNSGSAEN